MLFLFESTGIKWAVVVGFVGFPFPKKIIESGGSKSLLTHKKSARNWWSISSWKHPDILYEFCTDFCHLKSCFRIKYFLLPPRKLTWQWKLHHLKMYFLLKMGIFHGCIHCGNDPIWLPCLPGLFHRQIWRQISAPFFSSSTSTYPGTQKWGLIKRPY